MKIDSKWIIAGLCAAIVLIFVFRGGNGDSKNIINNLKMEYETL